MSDDRSSLARAICQAAYLEGDFLLRSGQRSSYYFDKYAFEADPQLLGRIAHALRPLVPRETDVLGGLELGGVPIVTALGLATGLPMTFVRKKAKEYGTMKCAEGWPVGGQRILVIEDVVTSGGQVVASTEALRQQGAIVEDALCVLDRGAGGADALHAVGVRLTSLFTLTDFSDWIPAPMLTDQPGHVR